jgi:hypothetical protein
MAPRALFRKYDIFAVQQHQELQAKEAVRALPEERLSEDEEKLATDIAASLTMEIPILDPSQIYQTDRRVQLDARTLPNRLVFDRSRPVPVDGAEITIHIPFKGDLSMFDVCPSQHNLNPPIAEIDPVNSEILLRYQTADQNSSIKARYEATLHEIGQHLEWLRPAASQTDGLKQIARAELAKRKQSNESHAKIVASLGIPRRTDQNGGQGTEQRNEGNRAS